MGPSLKIFTVKAEFLLSWTLWRTDLMSCLPLGLNACTSSETASWS